MKRLETTILKNLLFNEDYARKILPFIKLEYFSDNTEKNVFKEIEEHIQHYKHLPTYESIVINFTESKSLTEEQVRDAVQLVREINADKEEPTDVDWLINQTEKFCQDRALYNAIMKSVKILDDKTQKENKGAIPKMLSDALGVSFDTSVGHDYMDDADARFEFYHRHEEKIPFDLDLFNKITKGGLPKKTLNIALAGTGVGKSLFMCHCAAGAMVQGKNVLYLTLEMSEEKIAERIDANLLNVTIDDLMDLPKDMYDKKVARVREKTTGKLIKIGRAHV